MDDKLKQAVYQANLMLKEQGLVIFTWGNVSAIDRSTGEVIIKPSGVPYETMGAEDLVLVDLAGRTISGDYKPSSDLATHLEIYKHFPACGAVVHTHSRMATAWAQTGFDLPAYGTTHADYFYGAIPCTRALTSDEIQGAYEQQTGQVIAETFAQRKIDPAQVPAALVNSHGPFTWGDTPDAAVHNTIVLEEIATMAFHSRLINPGMGPMEQELLDRHFLRKHGADAYYGQRK